MRFFIVVLTSLALVPTAIASPLTHEVLRVKDDYVTHTCSKHTYEWVGSIEAQVDGRFADILFVDPTLFTADNNQVVGEVHWHNGTRVCMDVYNLLPRPVRVTLEIQSARVHRP